MDAQIQQAVDILSSGTNDENLKEQAFSFINQLKSSDDGWQHCVNLLTSNDSISPNVKFFIFQMLADRLPFMTNDQKLTLKEYIFGYLKKLISNNQVDPTYLRNGLAKTFALLFVHATLTCYQDTIKDLLQLTKVNGGSEFNEIASDYYLRTLLMIHQEIGDQMILRDQETADRSTLLKDTIRANDMVTLTTSWKAMLQHFMKSNSSSTGLKADILDTAIQCIGSYVSWIEINLIIDREYLSILYQFMASNNDQHKIKTANTFNEILHKKMPPVKKLELISFLNLTAILNQMNIKSKDMDVDVNVAFAKLIEQIGSELVLVLDLSSNEELSNAEFKNLTISKILEIFPFIFDFLENEYDDVSLEVFPFISNFLLLLKKNITNEQIDFSSLNNSDILTALLKKIILKKKYDEEDDGDDDDSIEQFNDVRSKLNSFHDSIIVLDETLALDVLISCINESLFESGNGDWRTIELGLYELTHYSEILRNNVMNLPKTMINNSRPYFVFNEMLCRVINDSTGILVSHPLIQLLFFELVLKHYAFFMNSSIQVEGVDKNDILLKVLKIFVSNFGVFSDNDKVKYRSWYLFYRFIKLTRPTVDDYVIEQLITSLLPLLTFKFEVANQQQLTHDIDLASLDESGSFESQLYLFESIGLLITIIKKPEQKVAMLESVLQPLFSNLEECINNLSSLNLSVVVQVHHSLISIGTILKGFENLSVQEFNDKFMSILQQISQVVLITLENFIDFSIVRESGEFCIVRLFILLIKSPSSDILQEILSKFISIFMVQFDKLKIIELINFMNFISQVFHHCNKSQQIYLLLNSLISPLFTKIQTRLEQFISSATDDFMRRDILDMQKSFISMLIAISADHLNSLWLTPENKTVLMNVIQMMLNYSYNYQTNDVSLVKQSLTALNLMVTGIGSGEVLDSADNFKNDANKFEQVNDVLINNSILISIELSFKLKPELLKDAQFRNNVLLDVSRLLRAIVFVGYGLPDTNSTNKKQKNGGEDYKYNEVMCNQLSSVLMNNLGLPGQVTQEFLKNLISLPDRQFVKYLISLVENYARSQ
ncbi:hypothetical protein CANARDRAFT_5355 [[Candida] arabinofermentans NRRL YB-2248]|uniref:Exportin-T n=1 Tax=[Candida] arabinofermentans NRRL YB-2248 TaxID=983967 RepID=A0A1E4T8G2_9ASCO|nr:hypothetical protein CANARDRAFT_5355 [[Candida] arabinofermentans NRRL YB-2248]